MQFHNGASNRLVDNRLTELLRVRVTADAPRVGDLRIESGADAQIKLNPQGEVVLSRPGGQVYGSSSDPISVVVDATGATLALDHASMGVSASLQLRELWLKVVQGAVRVDQLAWGSTSRRWRVQPLADTGEIEFELGSLPAGREYSVRRNGVSIGRFTVEANGRFRFSDRIEGLAVARYEVR